MYEHTYIHMYHTCINPSIHTILCVRVCACVCVGVIAYMEIGHTFFAKVYASISTCIIKRSEDFNNSAIISQLETHTVISTYIHTNTYVTRMLAT